MSNYRVLGWSSNRNWCGHWPVFDFWPQSLKSLMITLFPSAHHLQLRTQKNQDSLKTQKVRWRWEQQRWRRLHRWRMHRGVWGFCYSRPQHFDSHLRRHYHLWSSLLLIQPPISSFPVLLSLHQPQLFCCYLFKLSFSFNCWIIIKPSKFLQIIFAGISCVL